MAKNQINFNKMSELAKGQLETFKTTAIKIAEEDLRYKAELKPLKAERENILKNRENDIEQGLSVDDVIRKFPIDEVDRKIRKAEVEHMAILEPLNKTLRDTYEFIPPTMHESYKKKIEEHKRGDFLNAISDFLVNLGIEDCTDAQIRKFAEIMSDKFGARYAQSKKIVENGTFTTTMNKAPFCKLFMATFCDTFVK